MFDQNYYDTLRLNTINIPNDCHVTKLCNIIARKHTGLTIHVTARKDGPRLAVVHLYDRGPKIGGRVCTWLFIQQPLHHSRYPGATLRGYMNFNSRSCCLIKNFLGRADISCVERSIFHGGIRRLAVGITVLRFTILTFLSVEQCRPFHLAP